MSADTSLHDRDFYAWSREQAELLRAGKVGQAELGLIAQEIESMGKAEKRELVSRLTVLLLHLLKWRYQANRRGNSSRLSIADARDEIADILDDNPSLGPLLGDAVASAYRFARRKAAIQTLLSEDKFPENCPWTFDESMAPGFCPD